MSRHFLARVGINPGVNQRQLDIAQAGRAREKIECLENKTDFSISNRASSSSFISATFFPLNSYRPEVGVSRQPSMFMSVDFPLPLGTHDGDISFR